MSYTVKLWSVLLGVVILLNVLTALLAILPNALAALLASRDSVEAFAELGAGNIIAKVASVVDSLEFSVVFVQRAKNFSTTPGLDSSVSNILTWLAPAVANAGAAVGCYCLNNATSIVVFGNTNETGGADILDVWISGEAFTNETFRATYNVTSSLLVRYPDTVVPFLNCTALGWNTRFSATSGTHWSSDLPSLARLRQSEPAIVTGGPLYQSAVVQTVVGTVSYVYTGLQELLNSFEILTAKVQIFVYPDNGASLGVAGSRLLVASVNPTPSHVGVPLERPSCPNGTLPCLADEGTAFSYSGYIRANTSSAAYATRSDVLLLTLSAAKTMFVPTFASAVVICVVCSVIAIVVVSVIAGHVLSGSLNLLYKLEWHLQAVSLLTSDVPAVSSRGGVLFHEVDRILAAYESMHDELQKMKAHLPQSVLAQLQREMAEEDSLGSSENDLKSLSVDQQLTEMGADDAVSGANPLVTEQSRSAPVAEAPLTRDDVRGIPDDTHSQTDSQISFTMQRARREGRPTLRSLKDLCVVSAKKVTVIMANAVGFHRVMESRGAAQAEALHTTLLETILRVVNQTSGVVDFCHGDRFLISFNASTSCLNHSVCAAEAALRVTQQLRTTASPDYQGIRFGISSSEALCGVFGNDVLKRFSIIGSVVNHAFTLMQQSRAEEAFGCGPILICSTVFARTRARYVAEHVNYVLLPGNPRPGLISCLRSVRPDAPQFELVSRRLRAKGTKGARNQTNETVHESDDALQRMYDSTNVDAINRAFECFAGGDVAGAQALAVSIPDSQSHALRKALRVCS